MENIYSPFFWPKLDRCEFVVNKMIKYQTKISLYQQMYLASTMDESDKIDKKFSTNNIKVTYIIIIIIDQWHNCHC